MKPSDVHHHLGPQVQLRGHLTLAGCTHFEGTFHGEVHAQPDDDKVTLLVSPSGRVSGIVQCPVLVVGGLVEGDVTVGHLQVKSSGVVRGRVSCQKMTIEAGGRVEGPTEVTA